MMQTSHKKQLPFSPLSSSVPLFPHSHAFSLIPFRPVAPKLVKHQTRLICQTQGTTNVSFYFHTPKETHHAHFYFANAK